MASGPPRLRPPDIPPQAHRVIRLGIALDSVNDFREHVQECGTCAMQICNGAEFSYRASWNLVASALDDEEVQKLMAITRLRSAILAAAYQHLVSRSHVPEDQRTEGERNMAKHIEQLTQLGYWSPGE